MRSLRILLIAISIAGCTHTVTSNPNTYSVRAQTAPLKATQIAVVNGYSAETRMKIIVGDEVDLRQVTDTAIKVMSRHLENSGMALEPQAPKSVTLKVSSVSAEVRGFAGTRISVRLEAQFGDGTTAAVSAENNTPGSKARALDGALLFAVTAMLNNARFVDYINR